MADWSLENINPDITPCIMSFVVILSSKKSKKIKLLSGQIQKYQKN
jgi:hypothetical protein